MATIYNLMKPKNLYKISIIDNADIKFQRVLTKTVSKSTQEANNIMGRAKILDDDKKIFLPKVLFGVSK